MSKPVRRRVHMAAAGVFAGAGWMNGAAYAVSEPVTEVADIPPPPPVDVLPAWRWDGFDILHTQVGSLDFSANALNAVASLFMLIATGIWRIVLFLARFSATDVISGNGGTLNRVFWNTTGPLHDGNVQLVALLVACIVVLFGVIRSGFSYAGVFRKLGRVVVPLGVLIMLVNATAPHTNASGYAGSPGFAPRVTPGWFVVEINDKLDEVATLPVSVVSSSDTSFGQGELCGDMIDQLHADYNERADALGVSSLRAIPQSVSAVWEVGYLNLWARAHTGNDNAANDAGCVLAEYASNVPTEDRRDLMRDVLAVDLGDRSLFRPASTGSDEYRASTWGWIACDVTGSSVRARPEWDGVQAVTVGLGQSIAQTIGLSDEDGGTEAEPITDEVCQQWWNEGVGGDSEVAGSFLFHHERFERSTEEVGRDGDAYDTLTGFAGFDGGERIVFSLVAVAFAILMLVTVGALVVGTFLAQLLTFAIFAVLGLLLISFIVPVGVTDKARKQLGSLLLFALAGKFIFTMAFSVFVLISGTFNLIVGQFGNGDGIDGAFAAGLSLFAAWWATKKMFSTFGIEVGTPKATIATVSGLAAGGIVAARSGQGMLQRSMRREMYYAQARAGQKFSPLRRFSGGRGSNRDTAAAGAAAGAAGAAAAGAGSRANPTPNNSDAGSQTGTDGGNQMPQRGRLTVPPGVQAAKAEAEAAQTASAAGGSGAAGKAGGTNAAGPAAGSANAAAATAAGAAAGPVDSPAASGVDPGTEPDRSGEPGPAVPTGDDSNQNDTSRDAETDGPAGDEPPVPKPRPTKPPSLLRKVVQAKPGTQAAMAAAGAAMIAPGMLGGVGFAAAGAGVFVARKVGSSQSVQRAKQALSAEPTIRGRVAAAGSAAKSAVGRQLTSKKGMAALGATMIAAPAAANVAVVVGAGALAVGGANRAVQGSRRWWSNRSNDETTGLPVGDEANDNSDTGPAETGDAGGDTGSGDDTGGDTNGGGSGGSGGPTNPAPTTPSDPAGTRMPPYTERSNEFNKPVAVPNPTDSVVTQPAGEPVPVNAAAPADNTTPGSPADSEMSGEVPEPAADETRTDRRDGPVRPVPAPAADSGIGDATGAPAPTGATSAEPVPAEQFEQEPAATEPAPAEPGWQPEPPAENAPAPQPVPDLPDWQPEPPAEPAAQPATPEPVTVPDTGPETRQPVERPEPVAGAQATQTDRPARTDPPARTADGPVRRTERRRRPSVERGRLGQPMAESPFASKTPGATSRATPPRRSDS